MRNALHIVLVLVAFGAAGCSSESVAERSAACGAVDWRAYGVTDGRLGVPPGERTDYFARCRAVGVTVDETAYALGRAEGLAAYCTAESGYDVGISGRSYRDVCTGPDEVAFLQGLERGRKDRPRAAPQIGVGIGVGTHGTRGGIGIGVPLYYGGGYYGPGFHGGYPWWDDHHFHHHRHYDYGAEADPTIWHRTNRRVRTE